MAELGSKEKTPLFFRLNFPQVQVVASCLLQSLHPTFLLTASYCGFEILQSYSSVGRVFLAPDEPSVKPMKPK